MKAELRSWLLHASVLLVLLALGGALVLLTGVVPLTASSGHWGITRWVLELGKERSVALHTLGIEAPKLEAAQLVFKGAGHFETGCRPCHGAPGLEQPRVAQSMLPQPPDLSERVKQWEPDELFYIVKHGIKLTGMPAWPALGRDDEVWAMIAFLLELPELDSAEYRELAYGPSAVPIEAGLLHRLEPTREPLLVSTCARCHGIGGQGRMPASVPKLSGQRPAYLLASLEAFAAKKRHSGMMGPIAASLRPEQRRELADYYADTVGAANAEASAPAAPAVLARGKEIANLGIPDQGIPSCSDCHGPGDPPRNPLYPELAGQFGAYLLLQLELFKSGDRGGTEYAHLMRHVASRLSPEQMQAVAAYYASLPSAASGR